MDVLKISVLTLVHERPEALRNMLSGLARNTVLPEEVIIVHMNEEERSPVDNYPFRVVTQRLDSPGQPHLSAARNLAASVASHPFLIFLDVDCIPDIQLVESYRKVFSEEHALWSGRVRYLPKDFDEQPAWQCQLDRLSTPDPVRANLNTFPYELFWSLNFGCSAFVFKQIGGFDESFTAYGGEDTDFAFSARLKTVPHRLVEALSYHQYHPSYSPPVNHLQSIVAASRHFHRKWGCWPMEGWLKRFQELDYINWSDNEISILRFPDPKELSTFIK